VVESVFAGKNEQTLAWLGFDQGSVEELLEFYFLPFFVLEAFKRPLHVHSHMNEKRPPIDDFRRGRFENRANEDMISLRKRFAGSFWPDALGPSERGNSQYGEEQSERGDAFQTRTPIDPIE
jgi:hypothetical protein